MYTRAQGLRALESFRHSPGWEAIFNQPVVLRMRLLVRLASHKAPSAEDLAEFSKCCAFAAAEPGNDDQSFYTAPTTPH
ncbi:hypothetical protein ENSA5_39790 [Enhygromyxa salina]|uniref:Uncharacterized protein n=1 Tax=Enhygromyxa salina TaxID=215803 RepID=A0A2S9XR99_9BACT|nr:hypothetical protein ENSA5_39790 [Enhygromyxa salina]